MLIKTDELSADTKVWIYQSDKPFTTEQETEIIRLLSDFVSNWESHSKPVHGSFEILDHHFVILFGDLAHSDISGCSIDSSVKVIREIEQKLSVNLLDKSKVAYQKDTEIRVVDFRALKELAESNEITAETNVFDNSVNTLSAFQQDWKTAAANTWMKRYFN